MLSHSLKVSVFLILYGCLTQIEFDLGNQDPGYAISGQVSTVPHRNLVQLSRTNGVRTRPLPVDQAQVRLYDDLGNEYLYERSATPGTFVLPGFTGIPGRSYHIEVDFFEGGSYRSTPERLPMAGALDDPHYEFENRTYTDGEGTIRAGNFINIITKPTIPTSADPLYLGWSVDEAYIIVPTDFPDPFGYVPPNCYVTQGADPQRLVLYNNRENAMPSDDGLLIASRPVDNSFHTRHYFMTYVSSMTAGAFEYWRKVDVLVNQVGSIFDTPPATITGNIEPVDITAPDVFGYFRAVNEDYHKFFLTRFEIPYPFLPYCEYDAGKSTSSYPYECLDCIDAPNSSYSQPTVWD